MAWRLLSMKTLMADGIGRYVSGFENGDLNGMQPSAEIQQLALIGSSSSLGFPWNSKEAEAMRAGAGGGGKAVRARFAARSCPAHPISSSERYWLSLTRHLRRTIAVQSTRIGRRAPRPRAMSSRYLICFPPLFPSLFTSLFRTPWANGHGRCWRVISFNSSSDRGLHNISCFFFMLHMPFHISCCLCYV